MNSEGLQLSIIPRGRHHKARLWATWRLMMQPLQIPRYVATAEAADTSLLRWQEKYQPVVKPLELDSEQVDESGRLHVWVQNCCVFNQEAYSIWLCLLFFDKRRHCRLFSRTIILFVVRDFSKSLIVMFIRVSIHFSLPRHQGAWVDSCSSTLGVLSRNLGILVLLEAIQPPISSSHTNYQDGPLQLG